MRDSSFQGPSFLREVERARAFAGVPAGGGDEPSGPPAKSRATVLGGFW